MPQSNRIQNLVVGGVFLGGIVLLGLATLLVRGVPWADAMSVRVRFPTVNNLSAGEKVLVRGVHVGQVEEITYDPSLAGDENVVVRFTMDRSVPLTQGTQFRVRSAGPLGGHYLEIIPAPGPEAPGDWEGFVGRSDGDVFEQIEGLVKEIRDGQGLLPNLIRDEQLARKTENTLDEFRKTFENINVQMAEGNGLLPRLLRDDELASKVEQTISEFGTTFRSINSKDGTVVEEGSLISDIRQLFKDAVDQKGIVGMLFRNSEARDDLKQTIARLREVVGDAGEKDSVVRRLFSDEHLARRVGEAVEDFHNVIHKVDSGEGTIGQLVNNRKAWDELVRILVLARESIEDLREQAPINTFANVLFAVF